MQIRSKKEQQGITLVGLIFVLLILGGIGVLALKVFPTVSEYMTIKKAIVSAKAAGSTPQEIRSSFDKNADIGYVTSISGKDLIIQPGDNGLEVSFDYQKIIPLVGPASLMIEYQGSTSARPLPRPVQ